MNKKYYNYSNNCNKLKIYVFGNPLVPEDLIPSQFINELRRIFPRIHFEIVDPNENFPPVGEKNLIILDTVIGIKKPMILDISDFEKEKSTPVSPHDYDLLFHLLLLKKLKKIDQVQIIGVPSSKTKRFLKDIKLLITQLTC